MMVLVESDGGTDEREADESKLCVVARAVADESSCPPGDRLHCKICNSPIATKVGQFLGGDKHWGTARAHERIGAPTVMSFEWQERRR